MCRASTLGRHHAGAHRGVRRADSPKQLAIDRLLDAAQDCPTLAGRIVGCLNLLKTKPALRIERGILLLQTQPAIRHKSKATPLETLAQLEELGHLGLCPLIAPGADRANVLVFHLMAPFVDLP